MEILLGKVLVLGAIALVVWYVATRKNRKVG